MNKEFWNRRYASNPTVYGDEPNVFLKEQLETRSPGRILFPGEGEGRNAIYAASRGWKVEAFDYSEIAREKALRRAHQINVELDYQLADFSSVSLPPLTYDAIALIYVHLLPAIRSSFHHMCMKSLKRGGIIILESFEKDQFNRASGGPKNPDQLYDLDEVISDFSELRILEAGKHQVLLQEGAFHSGISDIIRLTAVRE